MIVHLVSIIHDVPPTIESKPYEVALIQSKRVAICPYCSSHVDARFNRAYYRCSKCKALLRGGNAYRYKEQNNDKT